MFMRNDSDDDACVFKLSKWVVYGHKEFKLTREKITREENFCENAIKSYFTVVN